MAQQQATKPNAHLTFADDTAFRQLSWSWSRSVDEKDWKLLLDICAPEVRNYYKQLDPSLPNDIVPRKEFVDTWSSQSLVGDERCECFSGNQLKYSDCFFTEDLAPD